MKRLRPLIGLVLWFPALLLAKPISDAPFWQDVAVRIQHAPELTHATFKKLCLDKENTVYVLTDKGVARVFDVTLALDKSYRPLAGRIPKDIALTADGDLAYLFEGGWLSNGRSGAQNLNADTAWLSRPAVRAAEPGMPWPELTACVNVRGGRW